MNLPKVFQNKNINNIDNAQEYFHSTNKPTLKEAQSKININDKINRLLQSNKFIYKIKTIIKTRTNEFETIIIGKTNNKLITFDNELIDIKDIIDINEK